MSEILFLQESSRGEKSGHGACETPGDQLSLTLPEGTEEGGKWISLPTSGSILDRNDGKMSKKNRIEALKHLLQHNGLTAKGPGRQLGCGGRASGGAAEAGQAAGLQRPGRLSRHLAHDTTQHC